MVRHVEPEAFGEPADARTIRTAFFSGTYIHTVHTKQGQGLNAGE